MAYVRVITGINHVTLAVRDLNESYGFYRDVLGFVPRARWPKGAYFAAGTLWVCLIADRSARTEPLPEYTHIAFAVPAEHFDDLAARIRASGATIWQENSSEGASLYFLDPNGHKLEIHVTGLKDRLAAARQAPWPGLEIFEPTEPRK